MIGIRIRKNGDEGVHDIEVDAIVRRVVGIGSTVAAGLIASAVIGNIAMYRQVGELQQALTSLAKSQDLLTAAFEKQTEASKAEREMLRMNQEVLKRRLSLLDKKLD